jgi:hypothetical protein
MRRPATLEVVVRIRSAGGVITSEWTIRGERVELASFFPTGEHAAPPLVVSFDAFVEALGECHAAARNSRA